MRLIYFTVFFLCFFLVACGEEKICCSCTCEGSGQCSAGYRWDGPKSDGCSKICKRACDHWGCGAVKSAGEPVDGACGLFS